MVHRVVHGGEKFKDAVLIDEVVKEAIEQAFDLAPLHNPPNLKGIEAAEDTPLTLQKLHLPVDRRPGCNKKPLPGYREGFKLVQ